MERTNRLVVGAIAGTSWIISGTAAAAEAGIRIYLLCWLATALTSIWALGEIWVTRPNHDGIAKARAQLAEARLVRALDEQEDFYAAERRKKNRQLDSVV